MANFDRRGGRRPSHRALHPAGRGKKINPPLMHKRSTPCHEQLAEADRQEFDVSRERFNSMCRKCMGGSVDEWTCSQRCLIVECRLDSIVDVRAPDVNFHLGLHGVIMFIFACSNLGMHASYVCGTICTIEAGKQNNYFPEALHVLHQSFRANHQSLVVWSLSPCTRSNLD